ncbi:MAG: HAD hydrolase-like protein [Clostridiales bacterium]|nr:HAD hydrolase-like protein [Clostridiales bacterium]
MNHIYFDLGVFTFWSEESLDSRRLISNGGVVISDDTALLDVREEQEVDPDLIEMMKSLAKDGYDLNICDNRTSPEIKKKLKQLNILEYFNQIVSGKTVDTLARNLKKLRQHEDFSIFVGCSSVAIEAAVKCQIPVVAYGQNLVDALDSAFCYAFYPLEIEDQVNTVMVIHNVARRTIESNARILGIDGIEFAGKTVFAQNLGRYFDMLGKEYQILDMEDYHRAVEETYKGEDPVEAYYFNGYNNEKVIEEVLEPFVRDGSINKIVYCLDSSNDSFINERHYQISEDGVMIIIGTMMFREPLIHYFDVTVYMRVDYRESEHRASLEESPIYGMDPVEVYRTKHIPAQKMYVQRHDPFENRDFVIDNSNYHRPFFIK